MRRTMFLFLNRTMRRCVVASTLLLVANAAVADTEVVDDITWTYTIVDGKASLGICKHGYWEDHYTTAIPSTQSGKIVIPDELGGVPVCSIGEYAFYKCAAVTNITMPSSITSIGNQAFYGCSGLLDIMMPEGVTNIGYNAFYQCTGLKNLMMSMNLITIGSYAFYGCSELTNVTVSSSVSRIGSSAFYGCKKLTSVHIHDLVSWCKITFEEESSNPLTLAHRLYVDDVEVTELDIPEGTSNICKYAFCECWWLTNVIFPSSMKSIGSDSFCDCYRIRKAEIPLGVTNIGTRAFHNCESLSIVRIPSSVTTVGDYAFNCVDWHGESHPARDVSAPGWKCGINFTSVTNLAISEGTTSVASRAFENSRQLETVTIPASVTNIGEKAFLGCSALKSFVVDNENKNYVSIDGMLLTKDGTTLLQGVNGTATIPQGVTRICEGAFSNCTDLVSISIPSSVTSFGKNAFWGCKVKEATVPGWTCGLDFSSVTNLVISEGTTSIAHNAFYGCSGLKSVTIPNSVTNIGHNSFYNCSGLEILEIPLGVMNIEYGAFRGCSGVSAVTIPSTTKSIGTWSFDGCSGLKSLIISDGVVDIGDCAFQSCNGLKTIMIPSSVVSIGAGAFNGCNGLTSFVVAESNSVYVSANGLLLERDGMTIVRGVNGNITIPFGVTSIPADAFSGCAGLKYVSIPGSVTNIGQNAFNGCTGLNSVTIPNGVKRIEYRAFYNCTGLNEMLIPQSVLCIGEAAFCGCGGLTNLMLREGLERIGVYAFCGCDRLNSVKLPASLLSLDQNAFSGCSALTDLTIPGSVLGSFRNAFDGEKYYNGRYYRTVTRDGLLDVNVLPEVAEIQDSLFYGCCNLRHITIPHGVTNIGDSAFCKCSSLTNVVIPSGVKRIGELSFYQCSALADIKIPESAEILGDGAFCKCPELKRSDDFVVFNNIVFGYYGDATVITIPSDVKSISGYAFAENSALTEVYIPSGVSDIGDHAFYRCTGITGLEMSDGIRNIGNYAFYGCSAFTDLTIPSSVTNIGGDAFYGCSALKNISVPSSVERISGTSFRDTAYWQSFEGNMVIIGSHLLGYSGDCPSEIVIPDGVTEICDRAFYRNNITAVAFPDSLERIGEMAFYHCQIGSLQFPSGLKDIGKSAFEEQIEHNAYYPDDTLRSVTMENVRNLNIGERAFYKSCITYIKITGTNIVIGASAFDAKLSTSRAHDVKNWGATLLLQGDNIEVGDSAFADMRYGGNTGQISINADLSGVRRIGSKAFYSLGNYYRTTDTTWYDCGMASIIFPATFDYVTEDAFSWTCLHTIHVKSLDSLFQKELLSALQPMWTYYYGVGVGDSDGWITELTIPEEWTRIPENAFSRMCLRSITVPASIKEIGSYALSYNTWLTNVNFYGDAPILERYVFDQDDRYSRESVVKKWYDTCTVTAFDKAKGWDDDGDGKWQGFKLVYIPSWEVKFKVDDYLMRHMTTDVSRLDQYVEKGGRALVPKFDLPSSTRFVGWNGDVEAAITNDAEFVARYESTDLADVSGIGELVRMSTGGAGDWRYQFKATDGAYVSGTFTGKGESWMELVVTNDAKVAFEWKASTLRLNNKPVNVLKCQTNGVDVLSLSGNTDWQSVELKVEKGTVVRWVYSQAATYGTDFENCGWVRDLAVCPKATVSFASEGEIEGTLPDDLTVYSDESVSLPGSETFRRALHTFAGWTDGEREYAAGETYDGTNGDATLTAVWRANTLRTPSIVGFETYAAKSQTVALESEDEGVSLYYSIGDGAFTVYVESFTVTGETLVRTYATKENCFTSQTNSVFFARQQYAVTFSAGEYGTITNGETAQRVRYGDDAVPVAVVADKWHQFAGWNGSVQCITTSVDLVAQYAPKTFTLKFAGTDFDWTYGNDLIGPTPTLDKHRLVGWIYQGTNYVAGSALPFDGADTDYTAIWEEKHLPPPVIDLPEYYDGEGCTASVTAQEGATIRCRIGDGDWFDYEGPFEVSGSVSVTAYATMDDWFDSECVTKATARSPQTFGEYLGMGDVEFASTGEDAWYRTNEVEGVAGYYLACGALDANETGILSATLQGKGTITFRFRASVEYWDAVPDLVFDAFVFRDNGEVVQSWVGETEWQEVSFDLTNGFEHVVSWAYEKDDGNTFEEDFENCVWLDSVVWDVSA